MERKTAVSHGGRQQSATEEDGEEDSSQPRGKMERKTVAGTKSSVSDEYPSLTAKLISVQ